MRAALVTGALVVGCGSDVVLGINPSSAPDAALSDATTDVPTATDAGLDASDATGLQDGSADVVAPTPLTGALGAAALANGGWVLAGYAGGPNGTESGSDIWTMRVSATGVAGAEARIDPEGGSDRANDVVATSDGGWVVAGQATIGGRMVAWVRRFDASGAEVWTRTIDSGANERRAEAVVIGQAGSIIVAGTEGNPADGWMARWESDGTFGWSFNFRTSGAASTRMFSLGIGKLDRIFVSGVRPTAQEAGIVDTPTVVQMSPDGVLYNSSVTRFPAGTNGTIRGTLGDGAGTTILCADTTAGAQLARVDDGLTTTQVYTYVTASPLSLTGCVFSTDGAVLLVGTLTTASGAQPWVAKHDLGTFTQRWTRTPAVAGPTRAEAIAAGPGGTALVAGRAEIPSVVWWSLEAP